MLKALRTPFFLATMALASAVVPPAMAADAPAAPLLLNGTVVTPERVIPNGWVAVQDGKITSVGPNKPDVPGARTLITKDFIFPGFVDLHNHPLYAVFPRWIPIRKFVNRYEWRNHPGYHKLIQTPEGNIVQTSFCDMNTYGELRALMGGTTSLLGVFHPADTPKVEPCIAGMVRNLDWASGFYGTGLGQERVGNVLGVWPQDQKLSADAVGQFKAGKLDLIAVHVAEGQRSDKVTQSEFAELERLGLLSDKTAIIHGVALSRADFAKMAKAGASLIWSPRSNFELYGDTADLDAAFREEVTVALAPDWSPTGSNNMFDEIAYAWRVIEKNFDGLISEKRLFEMATSIPARIAKIDDKVGSLKPGLYADLFLLRATGSDPYKTLVASHPRDVTLTMVGGVPLYGALPYFSALGIEHSDDDTVGVCGVERALNPGALPAGGMLAVGDRLAAALADQNIVLTSLADCTPKS